MNKKYILWGAVVIVIIVGAILTVKFWPNSKPVLSSPSPSTSQVGLANPASVNCVNKGGQLEIRTDATGGQYGVCKFSDGNECEEWKLFRGECRANALDCSASKNSGTQKELKISLADIKDKAKYAVKRQEAVSLINQCYEVKLTEEYEIQPGQISTQEGVFKNKISRDTRVFDKLKFYPKMELLDYEGVALDGGLTYATTDGYDAVFNFYKDSQVSGYRSTPTPTAEELRWTDIDTTQKVIIVKFTRSDNGKTLIKFDFIEPLSAD